MQDLEQKSHDLSAVEAQELRAVANLVETDIAVVLDGVLATLKPALERSQMQVENHLDIGIYLMLTYAELLTASCPKRFVSTVWTWQRRNHPTGCGATNWRSTASYPVQFIGEPEVLASERFASARALLQVLNGELIVGSEAADNNINLQRVTIRLLDSLKTPILFVDDNVDTLRLYQHYLAHSRYQFVGCSTPMQSLQIAKDYAVHCIILDVLMPELDGLARP